MILRVREPRGGGIQSPALKTPEPHSASTVWGIKESGPGTFIFEFSVKFWFEWYQFRRLKPKPCPIGEKTMFPLKIVSR